jgi:uncharacterized protein (TIGR02145 family)
MKIKTLISGIILLVFLTLSCKKNSSPALPVVTTEPVSDVLYTTATSGGVIVSSGGDPVIAEGVCWAKNPNPSTQDNAISDYSGSTPFTSLLTGLSSGTTYYLRAFATNKTGTAYGEEISFTTKIFEVIFNPDVVYGTLSDIDGNNYKTIVAGSQTWMAENLKTTRFNNGIQIPLITNSAAWTNLFSPGFGWFDNNDSVYKNIYGGYYNWFAVNDGHLCPVGWHVPADSEWQLFLNYLGGISTAGSKIKETGAYNWIPANPNATNGSGFTALPGGIRSGNNGLFGGQGKAGGWWSSTDLLANPLSTAWSYWALSDSATTIRTDFFKNYGINVRCVKDQ